MYSSIALQQRRRLGGGAEHAILNAFDLLNKYVIPQIALAIGFLRCC